MKKLTFKSIAYLCMGGIFSIVAMYFVFLGATSAVNAGDGNNPQGYIRYEADLLPGSPNMTVRHEQDILPEFPGHSLDKTDDVRFAHLAEEQYLALMNWETGKQTVYMLQPKNKQEPVSEFLYEEYNFPNNDSANLASEILMGEIINLGGEQRGKSGMFDLDPTEGDDSFYTSIYVDTNEGTLRILMASGAGKANRGRLQAFENIAKRLAK